jgi:hypothetical protein
MASPPNHVMAPTVTYEYLFCRPSSERLRPIAQWKARGLLSGSCTPGITGHRLRLKNMVMTSSHQQHTAGESYATYQI